MVASKKSPGAPEGAQQEPTFEEALESLRGIVESMEEGSLPLDKLIERYEQGVKLAATCTKALEAAEERVKMITESAGGEPDTAPFEDEDEA